MGSKALPSNKSQDSQGILTGRIRYRPSNEPGRNVKSSLSTSDQFSQIVEGSTELYKYRRINIFGQPEGCYFGEGSLSKVFERVGRLQVDDVGSDSAGQPWSEHTVDWPRTDRCRKCLRCGKSVKLCSAVLVGNPLGNTLCGV